MKRIILTSLVLYLPYSISFAFFCPNNFNQIYAGSTMEEVTAACGKPDKQDDAIVKSEPPQEWSYFTPQPSNIVNGLAPKTSFKTQVTFDASGKAINITVNNAATNNTNICGRNIQVGDTRDTIEAACGKPSFINKQDQSTNAGVSDTLGNTPAPVQITTFTYGTKSLTFENGKLKDNP